MSIVTETLKFDDPDSFYTSLIDLHQGLSDEESQALNARLLLILANHIGERDVLESAFQLAKRAGKNRALSQ